MSANRPGSRRPRSSSREVVRRQARQPAYGFGSSGNRALVAAVVAEEPRERAVGARVRGAVAERRDRRVRLGVGAERHPRLLQPERGRCPRPSGSTPLRWPGSRATTSSNASASSRPSSAATSDSRLPATRVPSARSSRKRMPAPHRRRGRGSRSRRTARRISAAISRRSPGRASRSISALGPPTWNRGGMDAASAVPPAV